MPTTASLAGPRQRDVRLDFFRGLGMFIIFIAHIPLNPWTGWLPARFGFSDSTEIFVFSSGMASAIAFGKVFDNRGFLMGCARIFYRCWQVYWAHIGLFFVAATLMYLADRVFETGTLYLNGVNLVRFFNESTGVGLVGLLTLTYVPNLFDILPMYLVILAMIPLMMALSRVRTWVPVAFSLALWAIATQGYWQFSAEPWSERRWFFHPLAWQMLFFTGFGLMRGWIPAPPVNKGLIGLAIAVIVIMMLMVVPSLTWLLPVPYEWTRMPRLVIDKSLLGVLRYVHFLALAYLAYVLAGEGGRRLAGGMAVEICRKVGQQALAAFVAGMILSLVGGVALTRIGYGWLPVAIVNMIGILMIIAVAYTVGWFKSAPWKTERRITRPLTAPPAAMPAE